MATDPALADLVRAARDVQAQAHVPYSSYRVGAALETSDGTVFTGCNVENANYSNSLHAEEVSVGHAIKEGHRSFERIVVSSDRRDGVTPCGMCRQTLTEFCEEDFVVICDGGADAGVTEYTLGELLPNAISEDMLVG